MQSYFTYPKLELESRSGLLERINRQYGNARSQSVPLYWLSGLTLHTKERAHQGLTAPRIEMKNINRENNPIQQDIELIAVTPYFHFFRTYPQHVPDKASQYSSGRETVIRELKTIDKYFLTLNRIDTELPFRVNSL